MSAPGFAIIGAGSVGLHLGGRLALAGIPVVFVVRRPEAARALAEEGVTIEAPDGASREHVHVSAHAGIEAAGDSLVGHTILVATRAQHTPEVARALGRAAPAAPIVCAQNDVDNEALTAEHCSRVLGLVVRQTTTRLDDTTVRAGAAGRLVLGAHTPAAADAVEPIATALRRAGFDLGVSPDIARDKWLKLCINLMSAINALVHRDDHASPAFVELKVGLLEEGRDVLAAAGIDCRPCEGPDRDLAEEIAFQRGAIARGEGARPAPLFNNVWSALEGRGELEANRFHRRIARLGEEHGIATPLNLRVAAALEAAITERAHAGSLRAADLLGTTRDA